MTPTDLQQALIRRQQETIDIRDEQIVALKRELAELRAQLIGENPDLIEAVLRRQFSLTPQQACIMAALYFANGERRTAAQLYATMPRKWGAGDLINIVRVQVYDIRQTLGHGVIDASRGRPGYRLTDEGRAVIYDAIARGKAAAA